jgi:lipid A 3-O-deacylase
MHKQNMKKLASIIAALTIPATNVAAGDFIAAVGNFDFSDKGKRAAMLELTYGFTEKNIDSKIGTIQPIAGALFTADSAGMAYIGAKIDYKLGMFVITPSFTPGLYNEGSGKDLGHVVEFKSQVNIGLNLGASSILSAGYSHISNASLGEKNPGANSYTFNFSTQF